jgi:hypothetical protein
MLTIVKKNDSYDVITYQLENEDNSLIDLTGASVNFVMGKKNKLITNASAIITSATSGIVSYQLTANDTLVSGTFLAEFVVTFANGTQKTYPSNGYITVDIEQNLDTTQNNVVVDTIATKQGDFEAKLDSILKQGIGTPVSAMNEYTWVATAGQIVFTFPANANYDPSAKWFQVLVGNVPVDNALVNRLLSTQFSLNIDPSYITAGVNVRAMWVEPIVPITAGHHTTHEINGQDEINIANLRNYQELVANPLSGIFNASQYSVIGNGVVGDSTSIQAMIDQLRTNVIADSLSHFYTIELKSGTYIIDKEIKMSPYVKFKSIGIVIFKLTYNGTAFWISPTSGDPTYAQSGLTYYLNKNVWNRGDYFDGSNGGFIFTTTLDKATTGNATTAIEFGDRVSTSNSFTPVSRYTLQNVNVFSLNTAFKWNGVNHYIGTYKNCHIEGNNHAVWLVSLNSGNALNSGENFNFENCIIAQQAQESFLLECAGHDISFTDCSYDFNASPIIRSKYSGISIRVNNCYLEMIGDGTGDELFYLLKIRLLVRIIEEVHFTLRTLLCI